MQTSMRQLKLHTTQFSLIMDKIAAPAVAHLCKKRSTMVSERTFVNDVLDMNSMFIYSIRIRCKGYQTCQWTQSRFSIRGWCSSRTTNRWSEPSQDFGIHRIGQTRGCQIGNRWQTMGHRRFLRWTDRFLKRHRQHEDCSRRGTSVCHFITFSESSFNYFSLFRFSAQFNQFLNSRPSKKSLNAPTRHRLVWLPVSSPRILMPH